MVIANLKEGEKIATLFLVASVQRGITVNGAPYLSVILQDQSGKIEGRKWDADEETFKVFVVGNVVYVRGDVLKHREKLQLKISEFRLVDCDEEDVDITQFIASSPVDGKVLINEIETYLAAIKRPDLKEFALFFLNKYRSDLPRAQAAVKIHHAFPGGLLVHILTMMKVAEQLITIYPCLNRDLLIAGIFFHDLGKLQEITGVTPQYTVKGKLVGHISLFHAELVHQALLVNLDPELLVELEHMLLAHHGALEHGSPVQPLTLEAACLFHLDALDAQLNCIEASLVETAEGEFGARLSAFDNRSFYKRKG